LETLANVTDELAAEPQLGPPLSLLDLLKSLPGNTTKAQHYRQQFAQLRHIPVEYLSAFLNVDRRQTVIATRIKDIGAGSLNVIVDRLEQRLADNPIEGVKTTIVGPTVTMSRTFLQLIQDLGASLLLATVLIFALMTVLFRSFSLGLISTLPNALALMGSAAILVLADTPLQFVSVLCFTVCLGISVDDTIHFLMRYLWHRREGENSPDAALHSMREIGPALLVTTCVFVGGHAVVLLSYIPALRMFAWLSCISLTLALVGDIIFLPAFVIWLTRRHSARQYRGRDA
jgi:predicted RND superfamily exporter protein